MGDISRGMALSTILVFLVGTLLGSVAPESGTVWAVYIGLQGRASHAFNLDFLIVGVIGIGVALYFGFRRSDKNS